MTILILGLIGFIGSHMVRVVADDWRTRTRERIGAQRYKAIYSLVSVISFGLMVWGYGSARHDSALLWAAPLGWYHATAGLMLLSMLCLAGFHARRSHLSVKLRHPMLWSVVLLTSAHLLVNGRVIDVVLFGSLLLWSVLTLISCYRRDARDQIVYPEPQTRATVINGVLGVVFYGVFAFFLHMPLIGVYPMVR